jgi:hypothetical protein
VTEGLFPDFIPEDLIDQGQVFHFSMARTQPHSIAWKMEAAIAVIEVLAAHAFAVLGGDVLQFSGDRLDYSGDYWDLPDEDVVLWEEYVEHTRERSIAFITDTARAKGEALLFTMFFIDERGYRRQIRDFGNVKYR